MVSLGDAASWYGAYVSITWALGFVIVGIILLLVGLAERGNKRRSKVVGAIVSRSCSTTTVKKGDGSSAERTHCAYKYSYTVDGKEYEDTADSGPESAEGDPVTVWYDPASPASSTLSAPGSGWWLIGIGAVVAGGGAWFGYEAYEHRELRQAVGAYSAVSQIRGRLGF